MGWDGSGGADVCGVGMVVWCVGCGYGSASCISTWIVSVIWSHFRSQPLKALNACPTTVEHARRAVDARRASVPDPDPQH